MGYEEKIILIITAVWCWLLVYVIKIGKHVRSFADRLGVRDSLFLSEKFFKFLANLTVFIVFVIILSSFF